MAFKVKVNDIDMTILIANEYDPISNALKFC